MNNIVWFILFVFIHKKVVSLDQNISGYIKDKFLTKVKLKANGGKVDSAYFSKLSTNDKNTILGILKSFTTAMKVPATKSVREKDPTAYCRSLNTCFECSSSMWYPCGWCHNYGCTDKPEKLCANAMTKHKFVDFNTTNDLRSLCPYIDHQGSILVPAGVRQNIQVKVHTSDPVLYEKELVCQLKFSNRVTHLKALILNDVVYCYPVTLDTVDRGTTNTGSLRLIWGGVRPFSNKIPITVYRCDSLAEDCDKCRLIPPEYGCGWCGEENVCSVADKCADLLKWNVNRLTCKSLGTKMFFA